MRIWCERALVGGEFASHVLVESDAEGRVTGTVVGATSDGATSDGIDLRLGLVVPGFANAHSHLFHRALRGRTHDGGGDFWKWRQQMYSVAARLDPERYRRLAVAVFSEILASGYTAVGEFHYVHHRPDGQRYPGHAMELALAVAAEETGIRLTLLDTCYLTGGIGQPLSPEQIRFGDGTAERWLERWHDLRDTIAARHGSLVTLGAAIHSVRAVPDDAIATIIAGLPPEIPLHIHLSEQPLENRQCADAYGVSPTVLLHRLGALSERLTAVHATHLDDEDLKLLGDAGVSIALCPTTEADLGDGIGPGRALADAGARLCIGSDQNAVIDPLLELRGLEAGERLAAGRRGIFDPAELWEAGSGNGYASLGLGRAGFGVGDWCDLVELDAGSFRTIGADASQLVLAATASDVLTTVVGGRVVRVPDVADLLAAALPSEDS